MFRFIHLSDLHYHRDSKRNTEADYTMHVCRKDYPGHRRIITGDITDDGVKAQYQNAVKALGDDYICPGNHDYGVGGNLYSRKSAKHFDFHFYTEYFGLNRPKVDFLEDGDTKIILIGLDSCRATLWPGDFAQGRIGRYQRWCLARLLNKYNNYVRMVYLHHHPFYRHPFLALSDSKKLMKVLRGRCEVLLFGHKHKSEMWSTRTLSRFGIKFILASDDSPGKESAREIIVQGKSITVNDIKIS